MSSSAARAARWAILAALFLVPCGAIGVVETTEARYAEIAREMLVTRDFLIPRLDGLPHFDKPPGAYRAIAPGVALLGHNEWGARLPVAVAALLTVALTARVARFVGTDGERAAWILAASPLFFILFHLASSDPFLTLAVTAFFALYLDPRQRAGLLPFVALGIGVLIKGPVVFVPTLLPLVAAASWSRSWPTLRPLANPLGWLIVLFLGLSWYAYLVARVPGLASFLLGHELWQRFASTAHHRGGPPYYFLVLLAIGALPWTWATIRGLAARVRARADFERTAVAAWALVPLVFFSFSGSKLPGYVLPLTPALALSAAWSLERERWPRWTAPALLALFAVIPWFFPNRDEAAGSVRPVARYLKERNAEAVYECGPFVAGLPYYLGRTVPLVEVQRDVRFASPKEQAEIMTSISPAGTGSSAPVWVFGEEALARRNIPPAYRVNADLRWRKSVLLKAVSGP